MENKIYFVSDQHFGEKIDESKKLHKFIEFVEHIKGSEALFIVGDLFDFYFEYRTQIPKAHFEVLTALQSLKATGTKIYYIVGNHDFWVGDFFTNTLEIEVYKKPVELTLQGKKVFIAHNGGVARFDPLHWLLRNKLSIFLFYWLHPDIAQSIGRLVSKISTKTRRVIKWERLYQIALHKFELDFDAVVFGHIHTPKHIIRREKEVAFGDKVQPQNVKEKDFLLLGDWTHHFTYARLQDGRFRLLKW